MATLTRTREPLPRIVGWAAAVLFTGFVGFGLVGRGATPAPAAVALAVVLALAGGVGVLLGPARLIAGCAAVTSVGLVVLGNGQSANITWFCVCLVAGWLAMIAPRPVAITYWAVMVVVLLVQAILVEADPGWAAWIGGTTFSALGGWFGIRQHDLVVELRSAQAELRQRAQSEERARIARELHDVIAHSLTVSLLHVSAARLAVQDDPDEAVHALAEAERLGRASLDEVRQVVGLLRTGGDTGTDLPLPGGRDVPTLIEGFRRTGLDVHIRIDGDLASVPATVGLGAYRILQEALTNAARHAPRARSTVHLAAGPREVCVDVDSAGRPGTGQGHGLAGMRERAQALGGTCDVGPSANGWRVHARIPLEPRG